MALRLRPEVLVVVAAALLLLLASSFVDIALYSRTSARRAEAASRVVSEERLLRALVAECARKAHTIITVTPERRVLVTPFNNATHRFDPRNCPLVDIMLGAPERSVGICTDAALYAMHLGARILPLVDTLAHGAACGPGTARLFLEAAYPQWVSPDPRVRHLCVPNPEHLYVADVAVHARIDTWLCKTEVCRSLLRGYIASKGWKAKVWLVGHTSSDVSVGLEHVAKDWNSVLHVKGRSGLKHTTQLLECWASDPQLPMLTVVGGLLPQQAAAARDAMRNGNLAVLPPLPPENATGALRPEEEVVLVSPEDVRWQMARSGFHVCVSEREGFGHYLNEARGVGALVITTNHPPMNELVDQWSGVLVDPDSTSSYFEWQALSPYASLNAFVSWPTLCDYVRSSLALPRTTVQAMGRRARQQFVRDKANFEKRMARLKSHLQIQRRFYEASQQGRATRPMRNGGVASAGGGADGAPARLTTP